MKADKNAQEKINMIQIFEQNLQTLISQKQNLQSQALEFESSLSELKKGKKAYKIIGNLMVETNIDELKKDVSKKNEILQVRINSIEKQEDKIREKIEDAQKEAMEAMKKR